MTIDDDDRFKDWTYLGKGAHAAVYRAFDIELGYDVAIKLLHDTKRDDKALTEGMRREVLISRRLRHPNICPIHDIYAGRNGVGIVMDALEGIELRNWMDNHKDHVADTVAERMTTLRVLLETLSFAHEIIIHRDLKPSNVFLVDGDIGRPVIMDFGISVLGGASGAVSAGTPRYMAPEQVADPDSVDRRSDLFALGIVSYEIFTGRSPPQSLKDYLQTRRIPRVSWSEFEPLPSSVCPALPSAFDRLIFQLLSYSPIDRPDNAEAVLRELNGMTLVDLSKVVADDHKIESVDVPAGEYLVGSPPDGQYANEKPARKIFVPGFRIGASPVTNAEYGRFLRAMGRSPHALMDDAVFGKPDHPVIGVPFSVAAEFARWCGGRLPSEIEWEKAARGGARFAEYPWGSDPPGIGYANIGATISGTTPVNAYPLGRNPLGLWDMCGNVWEWCIDEFDDEFYRRLRNGEVVRASVGFPEARSMRGGSFETFEVTGRCAFRGHADPEADRRDIGFRVVFD